MLPDGAYDEGSGKNYGNTAYQLLGQCQEQPQLAALETLEHAHKG